MGQAKCLERLEIVCRNFRTIVIMNGIQAIGDKSKVMFSTTVQACDI